MNDVVKTLEARGDRYGDYSGHAPTSQNLKDEMRRHPGWARLSPDKRESLDMIQHKVARILNGDPEYKDNWHDIGGYAKLSEDRCKS